MNISKKRGSVLVFLVVLMAGIATVLLSSIDLGRMAEFKQRHEEDDLAWRLATDGAIAEAQGRILAGQTPAFQFTTNICDVPITVQVSEDPTWYSGRSYNILVTGTLHTKTRTKKVHVGKMGDVSLLDFGLWVNGNVDTGGNIDVVGDLYTVGTMGGTGTVAVSNDFYTSADEVPSMVTVSGIARVRQTNRYGPNLLAVLDTAKYLLMSDVKTLGNLSTSGLSIPSRTGQKWLRYHIGNLTVAGAYRGNGTIFVEGNVTISGAAPNDDSTDRLVIIATGNVTVSAGTHKVNVVAKGSMSSGGATGNRKFVGAVYCDSLNCGGSKYTFTENSYFFDTTDAAYNYHIPGSW